jgi:hypothetical protein
MSLPTRFILPIARLLVASSAAQDREEIGGLPPGLKALGQKGNRDGRIQREEIPANLRRFFERIDLVGDGVLTWQEVDEARARRFADVPKLEDVLQPMRQTGLNHGVAINGGLGFSMTKEARLDAFLRSMAGAPVFVGLQAEGREWPTLFSPQAIARFDYVFTDAMTIVDQRGRRVRRWIPQEVDIPAPEAFMDRLVDTIVGIIEREPINMYAHPTYLPDVLAAQHDRLWTPGRQQRVIAAAAKHQVAIEINSRLTEQTVGWTTNARPPSLSAPGGRGEGRVR